MVLRAFRPGHYPKHATRTSPARWWKTWACGLFLRWELWLRHVFCGVLFCFPPPSYVALWDSKTPHRPAGESISWCLESSSPSWLPPRDRSLSQILLPLFLSYILSYLLLKRMGCLSRCLVFTSIQKLFCGSCWAFKWSFDEFVGEKVVSPSYSSAILGPPPKPYISEINLIWSKCIVLYIYCWI